MKNHSRGITLYTITGLTTLVRVFIVLKLRGSGLYCQQPAVYCDCIKYIPCISSFLYVHCENINIMELYVLVTMITVVPAVRCFMKYMATVLFTSCIFHVYKHADLIMYSVVWSLFDNSVCFT